MKISKIIFEKIKVKLKKPFVVALGVVEYCETIIVKIETDDGICGYGEAAPFSPVTGESLDTATSMLNTFSKCLIGEDPIRIEHIHYLMNRITIGNSAAKAGIDIALHDILGKVMNQPLYKVLGGYKNHFETDMTIGISTPEQMAKDAVDFVNKGYKILKIKAGIDPQLDIEATRQIREAVGDKIRLRMDANQGWNVNSSINTLKALEEYKIEAVEQCLPYWDIDGSAYIRQHSNIAIMLDESLHTPNDAIKIIKKEAADILNIKLMKSSGIYPAIQINSIAEAAGLNCMLGCMLETKIGITASASLIAGKKNITDADIDSFTYIEDQGIVGGITLENGIVTLPETPGLGIEINL